jgi:hypothetical protein
MNGASGLKRESSAMAVGDGRILHAKSWWKKAEMHLSEPDRPSQPLFEFRLNGGAVSIDMEGRQHEAGGSHEKHEEAKRYGEFTHGPSRESWAGQDSSNLMKLVRRGFSIEGLDKRITLGFSSNSPMKRVRGNPFERQVFAASAQGSVAAECAPHAN